MTASQRAKQKCAAKENKPIKESLSAGCCCMVAPWVVVEDGRSYQLKITKTKQDNRGKTVPDKEEASNKENGKYELHIVAPPANKDGKVSYKKIRSNHKFLKKECDLTMLVKSGTQEKSIAEGGSFEIDTNGNIKGAININCEENKAHSSIDSTQTSQIHVGRNACIAGPEKQSTSTMPNYMDITSLNDRYVHGEQSKMSESELQEIQHYISSLDTSETNKNSEFKRIIMSIINPDYAAKELTLTSVGSKKCVSQPKVYLYIHDKAVYKGEISLSYGFAHTLAQNRSTSAGAFRNERIDVTRSAFKVEGKLDYELGDTHYIIEPKYTKGFDKNDDRQITSTKRKTQHLKRIDAENIFSDFREKVNSFHRFFDKVQKAQRLPIKINTGLTKFTFKADGSCDENPRDYDLERIVNNFEFDINIFDGSAITLDIFALGCKVGGPIGNVLLKARDYAEEKGQEIKLEFSMGGSINGNLKFSKPKATTPWSAEGKLGGTVNIEILGSVKIDGSVLWVKVAAGAYFKSASKETIDNKTEIAANLSAKTEKDDILIDGNLTFNGMIIYFASYLEVGSKNNESIHKTDGQSAGGLGGKSHTQVTAKKEFKAEGKWELINTWEGQTNFGKVENFLT